VLQVPLASTRPIRSSILYSQGTAVGMSARENQNTIKAQKEYLPCHLENDKDSLSNSELLIHKDEHVVMHIMI